uniref:DUF295 domain-containing protein n=3 Tax=Chenopodium quinoa TaxID=63459 RepID=A0A803L0W1_CHEQI
MYRSKVELWTFLDDYTLGYDDRSIFVNDWSLNYVDVVEFDGTFYVVTNSGRTIAIKVVDSSVKVTLLNIAIIGGDKKCLIKVVNDLLIIDLYTDIIPKMIKVHGIEIFKLDKEKQKWDLVKNLEGHAIFLSNHSSFSAIGLKGCKGNCIYFHFKNLDNKDSCYSEIKVGDLDKMDDFEWKCDEVGVFDLEKGIFGPLEEYLDDSQLLSWPPPSWVTLAHEIQGISPISSSGVVSSRLSRLVTEFRSLPEPIDRVKRLLDYAAVLPRLGESTRSPENRVPGCAAQVWLEVVVDEVGRMRFGADSDSEITKGFCSCLIFLLDGAFPEDVLKVKAEDLADMNVGLPESDVKCKSELRVNRKTFNIICEMLRDIGGLSGTKNMSLQEIVAMFLYTLAHHKKNRSIGHYFYRSGETVSRQFHLCLRAFLKLHEVLLYNPTQILDDCEDERWKSFKNCLGALDGTYINVNVPSKERPKYRTRKGTIAMNVLGVCAPNMQFIYVLPGWEDSAHDMRVLRNALSRPNGFRVP